MTIEASSGWFTKLDSEGRPAGPRVPFGAGVAKFSVEESEPDDSAVLSADLFAWHTLTIEVTALDLRTAYLLFGSRRIFGWQRPLAINGREYRRRVRRR